jgi:DNA-binding NarL/FixJ family response regulator
MDATRRAGGRVPQPHGAVAVGAGQQRAVAAERHPVHAVPGAGVQGRADGPAGGRVPQPDGAVGAGAGQQLAVAAERHRTHARPGSGLGLGAGVQGRADGPAGARIPQPHRAVAAGAGQQLAVGAERHPGHAVAGAGVERRADGLAGDGIPQPHGAVGAGAGQQLATGAERHREDGGRVGGQHARCRAAAARRSVLLDVRMPGLDGLQALRAIVASPGLAGTRVIVLTTFELDEYVFEALRDGASGFLIKDTESAELLRAVRVVAAGGSLLSPTVTRRVIGEFVARRRVRPAPHPGLRALTEREREVVGLVAEGLSNQDIAERLALSAATARTHVSRAMSKLGAHDRAQLVVIAFQGGRTGPDPR